MSKEIVNRVANSQLITIDLEAHYPEGKRALLDIKPWLFQEQILREKEFREFANNHNWSQYQNGYLALNCSSDAIIPSWAYLLLTSLASQYAKKVVVGNLELLESLIFQDVISNFNAVDYQEKPVIIKGCSEKKIPHSAYTLLIQKLQPYCKSIMYGEACSNVPLYKAKKK